MKTTRTSLQDLDFAVMLDGPQRLAQQRFSGPSPASRSRKIRAWLAAREAKGTVPLSNENGASAPWAMEAVAGGAYLLESAAALPPELGKALFNSLLSAVEAGQTLSCQTHPLTQQLLAGELGLMLASVPGQQADARRLARAARKAVAAGMRALLNNEGLLHAEHATLAGPLLACWTRCRALAARLDGEAWPSTVEKRYQRLVRNAWRLTRPDGTLAFSNGQAARAQADLLRSALQESPDDDSRRIAAEVSSPKGKATSKRRRVAPPSPAVHAESACLAALRADWTPHSPRLFLRYPGQSLPLEFACSGRQLLLGDWQCEVRRDGELLRPTTDWDFLCWFSDADVDYLELEIRLGDELRVQRHFLLARTDGFLLLADTVLGARSGQFQYTGRLPLAAGIDFRGADESREGHLCLKNKPSATVLPLALPEWRSDASVGELVQQGRTLELVQRSQGRAMFAPLFFDLRPARLRRRLTWRPLTVGESLAAVAGDVAVGYRVAIGSQQWLLYRALGGCGNRTLLGHNLSTETLVARFDQHGEVESLLEIE